MRVRRRRACDAGSATQTRWVVLFEKWSAFELVEGRSAFREQEIHLSNSDRDQLGPVSPSQFQRADSIDA